MVELDSESSLNMIAVLLNIMLDAVRGSGLLLHLQSIDFRFSLL